MSVHRTYGTGLLPSRCSGMMSDCLHWMRLYSSRVALEQGDTTPKRFGAPANSHLKRYSYINDASSLHHVIRLIPHSSRDPYSSRDGFRSRETENPSCSAEVGTVSVGGSSTAGPLDWSVGGEQGEIYGRKTFQNQVESFSSRRWRAVVDSPGYLHK